MSIRLILVVAVILALLAGVTILTHNVLTEPFPGHNDFMSRWEGVRSYWIDGLNPYGDEGSLNIQQRIFGRPAEPDEDPGYFAYPFYTAFLVWPLVYVDYAWASAIWMVLLEAVLIASLFLLFDIFRWRPKPWLLGLLLLWTLIFYYPARGLLLGQPGILVYFFEILCIWALRRQNDTLAGIALALSTIKPQMGFLLIPLLLLWALRQKRWRFILSFGVLLLVLLGLSFLLQPSWLSDWLAQVSIYSSYTALGSPVWIITQYYVGLGTAGEWAVNMVFYGIMLWSWYGLLIQNKRERFLWVIAITLTVTHLVAPRTATPHYVVFIMPLIFYFAYWAQQRRNLWTALTLLLLTILPWIHFVQTVDGEFEHPAVYLPLPFAMIIILLLTRRLWWRQEADVEAGSV